MRYAIAICMAVMFTLACNAKKEELRQTPRLVPTQLALSVAGDVDKLEAYYKAKAPVQEDGLPRFAAEETARFAAEETARFAAMLGLTPQHVRDMLALWWTESTYQQNTEGADGKSWGITQVRIIRIDELTKAWEPYGVKEDDLGSIYDPTRQVAMGVMAYSIALREAKGDRFQALRRYNGGNKGKRSKAYKQAHAHALRVVKARKAIFGE